MKFTLRNDQGQDEEQGYEIVGVVQSVKNAGVNNPVEPEVFAPISVAPLRWQSIMVRTAGPPLEALRMVRAAIWSVDPMMPLAEVESR